LDQKSKPPLNSLFRDDLPSRFHSDWLASLGPPSHYSC